MTREEAAILLKAELATMTFTEEIKDRIQALYMAIKALEELPKRRKEAKRWKRKALQAERHGEWQITKVEGGKIYVCSECSEAIYKSTFEENVHYYCNNCGAKMDKGGDTE